MLPLSFLILFPKIEEQWVQFRSASSPLSSQTSTCLIFQREAFAVPILRVQHASPAETLRRTMPDSFCQINTYEFQRCISCYWQRFFFLLVDLTWRFGRMGFLIEMSNAFLVTQTSSPCCWAAGTKAKINKLKVSRLREAVLDGLM